MHKFILHDYECEEKIRKKIFWIIICSMYNLCDRHVIYMYIHTYVCTFAGNSRKIYTTAVEYTAELSYQFNIVISIYILLYTTINPCIGEKPVFRRTHTWDNVLNANVIDGKNSYAYFSISLSLSLSVSAFFRTFDIIKIRDRVYCIPL